MGEEPPRARTASHGSCGSLNGRSIVKRSGWAVVVVLALTTLACRAGPPPPPGGGAVRSLPEADQREIEKRSGNGSGGAPPSEAQPLSTIADYYGASDKPLHNCTAGTRAQRAFGPFTWLQLPDDLREAGSTTQGETCALRTSDQGRCSRGSSAPRSAHEGVVSRFSPAEPMLIPGWKSRRKPPRQDRRGRLRSRPALTGKTHFPGSWTSCTPTSRPTR